ncbi:portal protein [Microvirgula aerodenitrificans]|uniref:portal protein n=1 Tax=Microvirgula aerodenitrificans TaxID=57480 RepID=UPI00048C3ED1|nr:hypothetical protein [Microvirgula aerodenitrificans]
MIDSPLDDEIAEASRRAQAERMQVFGSRLQGLIDRAVADKSALEQRWLDDLRQYEGRYDAETLSALERAGRSTAFVRLTRAKCLAAEARLAEMLLPTDDRNWDIQPTPEPDMPSGPMATQRQASADDAAARMRRRMDDVTAECDMNGVMREMLHDAVTLGTGIVKGPAIESRTRRRWARREIAPGAFVSAMEMTRDLRPSVQRVSPWDFFVDPTATALADAEWMAERHRMTRQALRNLARVPGFDADAIRELLEGEPKRSASAGRVDEVATDNDGRVIDRGRYEVWEYHGEIDREDLAAAGVEMPDDALLLVSGVVWICDGHVLKASLNPLDSGEPPYSVFAWEPDSTRPFGLGIPALCRDSQRVANAAWRMLLDNAAMSVMPQIVINSQIVTPVDGEWVLRPGKLWQVTERNTPVNAAFGAFPVAANLNELMQTFQTAAQLIDEETSLPQIAQGQQTQATPEVTKTAQGMAMLLSGASTVLRRIVKRFDDDMLRPTLSRLYDWFMQYDQDETIKGDMEIIALGSSSLLVREQTQQGLLNLLQLAQSSPVLGPMTDIPALYRKLVQSMSISADGLVLTDEQMKQKQPAGLQTPPPEMIKAQVDMKRLQLDEQKLQMEAQRLQMDMQAQQAELAMRQQTEMARAQAAAEAARAELAKAQLDAQLDAHDMQLREATAEQDSQLALLRLQSDRELSAAQIQAAREETELTLDSKHKLFNAEAALRLQTGAGI